MRRRALRSDHQSCVDSFETQNRSAIVRGKSPAHEPTHLCTPPRRGPEIAACNEPPLLGGAGGTAIELCAFGGFLIFIMLLILPSNSLSRLRSRSRAGGRQRCGASSLNSMVVGAGGTTVELRADSVGRSVLAEPGKLFSLNTFAARRDGLALPAESLNSMAVHPVPLPIRWGERFFILCIHRH